MAHCKKCLIRKIQRLNKQGKHIPKKLLLRLAQSDVISNSANNFVIGPYLQLIPDLLFPPNGQPLMEEFFLNIQYYNQGDYYNSYDHIFSDKKDGPYGMIQSASCQAISDYFNIAYKNNVPELVKNSVVVGKLLTPDAGANGYVDLSTLNGWMNQAQNNKIPFGGYMLWSAGYVNSTFPSNELVAETFKDISVKYKVMYIGSGNTGQVYTAEGIPLYAQAQDPDGSNARQVLTSYAEAGFNQLILAFWNYDNNSDWITDWTSINKDAQKQLIEDIHTINPECKVLVSGGGAYGSVGPASGIDGTNWGRKLAQYATDNNLDGVDLDLEAAMLGTQWTQDQYQWLKDAVSAVANYNKSLSISFAPVAPLCANPN